MDHLLHRRQAVPEKVGRRSDAVVLYQRRKTDARMGIKMPEVRARRAVLFEEIAADALAYSQEHKASFPGNRSTVGKLLPVFGKIPLANITPQSIKAYLDTRDDLTKTTINRYRGTISMIFQEAIRNGKATANPARLVRLHREDNSRVRFVTFAEEAATRPVIVLTGARQTGKTSTFLRLFPGHSFVSLDLPTEAEQAEKEPRTFLRKRTQYIQQKENTISQTWTERLRLEGKSDTVGK